MPEAIRHGQPCCAKCIMKLAETDDLNADTFQWQVSKYKNHISFNLHDPLATRTCTLDGSRHVIYGNPHLKSGEVSAKITYSQRMNELTCLKGATNITLLYVYTTPSSTLDLTGVSSKCDPCRSRKFKVGSPHFLLFKTIAQRSCSVHQGTTDMRPLLAAMPTVYIQSESFQDSTDAKQPRGR